MMFTPISLFVFGLVFVSAAVGVAEPTLLCRLCAWAYRSRLTAIIGLLLVASSIPVLVHYAGVLYPLDMLSLPAASIMFAAGLAHLLFPSEVKAFIEEFLKLKEDSFIRLLALTLTFAGIVLLDAALQ